MGSIFTPQCLAAYEAVFSDLNSESWLLLGYEGQKITHLSSGTGDLDELASAFDDAQVQYAFLRIEKTDDGGDSKRVKFVSVTWVGENAPAMKKGKVMNHKGDVLALFNEHVRLVECLGEGHEGCQQEHHCDIRGPLEVLDRALMEPLKRLTVAELFINDVDRSRPSTLSIYR